MIPSTCVICGSVIEALVPARHLPRFARCPKCGGYVTEEKGTAAYPKEYFTEEPETPKKSIFSPLLDFFLWLRVKKIQRILRKDTTPLNPPSAPTTSPRGLGTPPLAGGEGEEATPHILDYGCGNGTLVAYLRQKGFDADGYDPSLSAVALAQQQGLPVFAEIQRRQYALVMFWHSLEHSDTPLRDILSLKSSLAPRARLLIAVPNGDALEARLFGESFFCYDWPFHRVHFTPRALAVLLEKAGFRVVSTDHFNPEYTVSSLAQTFLNLFLPKNALYGFVSARRQTAGKGTLLALALVSLPLLVIFSPLLILFFVSALLLKKTAAFIMVGTTEQTRVRARNETEN